MRLYFIRHKYMCFFLDAKLNILNYIDFRNDHENKIRI